MKSENLEENEESFTRVRMEHDGAATEQTALGGRGGRQRRGGRGRRRLGLLGRRAARRGAQAVPVRLVLDGHAGRQLQDAPQRVPHARRRRRVRRRAVPHR